MKTALLSMIENFYIGDKPHEATFTIINLDDGSTAPLGQWKKIAVQSREAAFEWAAENAIRVVTELKAHVLHSDGSVKQINLVVQDGLAPGVELNGELVAACTRLRNADPTVASVRIAVPGYEKPYRWMGNYTAEHMAAVVARERDGSDDWGNPAKLTERLKDVIADPGRSAQSAPSMKNPESGM